MINLKTNLNLSYIDVNSYRNQFPEITDLEIAVIQLTKEGKTYSQIQILTGNPSKREIKNILQKYNIQKNSKTKSYKEPSVIQRIIGLAKNDIFDLDEFGISQFSTDGFFIDEDGNKNWFTEFDERTLKSILLNVAKILNKDIKSTEFKPE